MRNNNKKIEFGWQFLRYYGATRVILCLLLLLLPYFFQAQDRLYNVDIYTTTAISYLIVANLLMFMAFVEHQFRIQAMFPPLLDILFIAILAYAGYQSTSVYILLMALVAIVGIFLVRHRIGIIYGIFACAAIVFIRNYRLDGISISDFSDVSLQIAGILAVTVLANILARRLTDYEAKTIEQSYSIEKLNELNKQIIDKMNRGVVVVDNEFKVQHINQTAWYGLGLPEDPIGKPLKTIADELDYQLQTFNTLHDTSQGEVKKEGLPFRATNTGPQLLPNYISLAEGEKILITLDNYSEVLKRVQQLKLASLGQLTANIAHEVKNPLSAVSQASQLLSESSSLSKDEKELTAIIYRQSKRINEIIENVQKVSKSKPPNREQFELKEFIESFTEEYRQGLTFEPQLTIEDINSSLSIQFDKCQLKQILSNLFDNGLKYSFLKTKEYRLHVTAGQDPVSGDLFLDVIDEGPGISLEDKDKIFEPFYTTAHDGTGLGLYISKELCEANQARLDCIPVAFGGACFRISFDNSH
ncbi:sensor histidine kinase [Kangiella sediminilitoris]|uniref:histidine kinase n=1 Tax=Kangiella sediminilitoris TaxID=1144748 RepID=A0A1B3BB19_9GAMM|nr:ATP-binding protein [Kangiella sediminilitoris]AOE49992.1 Histidine kinase [Kangiella sediminilitoris]